MRLWLVMLLLPGSVFAHGVLIVPEDDTARTLMDSLVEQLPKSVSYKTAGGRAPAVACLAEKDAKKKESCVLEAASRAGVVGVLMVHATQAKNVVDAKFEVIELGSARNAFHESRKGSAAKWSKGAGPFLKKLGAALTGLKKVEGPPVPPEPPATTAQATPPPANGNGNGQEAARVEPKVEPTPPAPPKAADAPVAVAITPPLPSEPIVPGLVSPPPAKSKAGAVALTLAGVVAAGTAVAFTVFGTSAKGQLEASNTGVSEFTYNEAVAKQSEANRDLSIAAGAGVGAVVLGGLGAFLWSSN